MISVLYVDDEEALLDLCKIYLERTGELQIQTESSVKKAMERLSLESFDAIISDYQMPEMDGLDFLKLVRGSGNTIPFIIFTGRGREEVAIAALKGGADFYLQKGGDPRSQFAELVNQIKQIVRQRKAESSVRESEQMYRALFESAQDAIFLMESDRIIDCNRQTELLFGRTKGELSDMSLVDFSPEYQPDGTSSSEQVNLIINAALSGDAQYFEWRCVRSDGTLFDAEVSLNRITINRGYVTLSIMRDITQRKNDEVELLRKNEEIATSYEELMSAEEELREQYQMISGSEQKLRESEEKLCSTLASMNAIIQGSPIPQFVIDKNHQVIYWNSALTSYSGITAPEVLGTNMHWKAFYPIPRPCLADLLIEGDSDSFNQWYSGKYIKSPLIPEAYNAMDFFPHMKKEGVWLSFTAALIRDHAGEVIGAVETLEDITEQKDADLEILRMTQFQESIIMNANVWLMVLDASGKVMVWNHAAEEISGYLSGEVSGSSQIWKSLYPDSDYRHHITEDISRIIEGNRYLQNFQTTIRTKTGEKKEILWNTRVIHEDERHDGFVAIGIDITGRILAEQALHNNEATLRAIIKGSPIPLFVIDKNHRVIHWNTALEEYSGITADEIIGTDQQWRAFYPDKSPCIADMLIDADDCSLQEFNFGHYERSALIEGAYQAIEFFATMGSEGSWLFLTAAPIRDAEGIVIGAVETLEDITRQKNAEYALMESEERFRTLFSHASDAIFLHRVTKEGLPDLFIEVNETACNRLGYSRQELLNMSPMDIDSRSSQEKEFEYTDLLRREGHATFEAVHITKTHDEIPVEISTHIYEFRGEKVVLSIARDISERKRFESAIQNANTKLNLLSSITRHDILNQLTALTGYLDLSEDITEDPDLLDYIHKEKKTADTIHRQILFTRDYQTIGVQSPQWQNLKSTIQKAAGLLDYGAVSLKVNLDDTEVFADPLLEKVFFNLIDNSVRYGNGLTTIDFFAQSSDTGLTLICSDDGGGIPSAEKENIFNRKYFSNTGFGLFLSREILSITGFKIAETGEFGVGARFEIHIPKGNYRP